jgi:hypothetical protein
MGAARPEAERATTVVGAVFPSRMTGQTVGAGWLPDLRQRFDVCRVVPMMRHRVM